MTPVESKQPVSLAAGEKISLIMVYCPTMLVRGEVISAQAVRVSTWLRTPAAPDYMEIHNAQVLMQGVSGSPQSLTFPEYYIPINQISAYHLVPPAVDPVDYDPGEPNRKMEAVTVLVGGFKFNGHIRMAGISDLSKYLNVTHETFMSLYDIDITNPGMPGMGVIHVQMALIRSHAVTIAARVGTAI